MKKHTSTVFILLAILAIIIGAPGLASAQTTEADYARATGLRAKYQPLALDVVDRGGWIGKTSRYWYRKSVAGGNEFWIADAAAKKKSLAFDHARLAAALTAASGEKFEALALPFVVLTFSEDGKSVEFGAAGGRWSCDLATYALKRLEALAPRDPSGYPLSMWERGPAPQAASKEWKASPDGKWEAAIRNYNVVLRAKGQKPESVLSRDGTEGDYYTFDSIAWSPDSKRIAACRLRRGYHRVIQYVESSPADQLQPKYHAMEYAKPGDVLDVERPVLFHVDTKARIEVDPALFPNPYEISRPRLARRTAGPSPSSTTSAATRPTGSSRSTAPPARPGPSSTSAPRPFSLTASGAAKNSAATSPTAARSSGCPSATAGTTSTSTTGRPARSRTRSRRGSGSSAASTGSTRRSARSGFRRAASYPDQDPYFVHAYRVNFDGTGLARLTERDGNHAVAYSPDGAYFVDTLVARRPAPVTELRSAADGKTVMTVEKGDIIGPRRGRLEGAGGLRRQGPRRHDRHLGRHLPADRTSIPTQEIPGHRVHLRRAARLLRAQVVQRLQRACRRWPSSASSSCRSTAWARATAPRPSTTSAGRTSPTPASPTASSGTRPSRRSTRGTTSPASASTAPRPAARTRSARCSSIPTSTRPRVAACGCHDNRMDKIWWNEQWMGWPRRPALRRVLERRQRRASCRASCCSSSARWTPTSIPPRPCRSSTP